MRQIWLLGVGRKSWENIFHSHKIRSKYKCGKYKSGKIIHRINISLLHVFFLEMKLILGFRGSCNCRSAPLNISSISAHSYFNGNISEQNFQYKKYYICNIHVTSGSPFNENWTRLEHFSYPKSFKQTKLYQEHI